REPAGCGEAAARADGSSACDSSNDRGRCAAVNKVIFAVAVLFVVATVSTTTQDSTGSKSAGPAPKAPVSPKPTAALSAKAEDSGTSPNPDVPGNYQAMVAKYCVGCHNTRNPLPAGAPLALDKANFADPGAD